MLDECLPDDLPHQPSPLDSLCRVARLEGEQLEQERLASLSKLARGMAHDFNNFLMVILGQAETWVDHLAGRFAGASSVRSDSLRRRCELPNSAAN